MPGGEVSLHLLNVPLLTLLIASLVLWRYRGAVLGGRQDCAGGALPVATARAVAGVPAPACAASWSLWMKRLVGFVLLAVVLAASFTASAQVQTGSERNLNLVPKYGQAPKNKELREVDERYLAEMDKTYAGDRRKAAEAVASRGWKYYFEANYDEAMRRFNQAWLLDASNGRALWGMGAVLSEWEQYREALRLFSEAHVFLSANPQFRIDYARALGICGIALKDQAVVDGALMRFADFYSENSANVNNPQNWALTLYLLERYDDAWQKIRIAQSTPDSKLLSNEFIDALRQRVDANK
jgi:tetratricopeptide (TPR) repeat protein